MYLSILSNEEKKLFLDLAYDLASADGDVGAEEKTMVQHYCEEMDIEWIPIFPIDRAEIIEKIKNNSTIESKKIIIFELIGLAMADNKYEEAEKNIIMTISSKIDLTMDYVEKCEKIIGEYLLLQGKINSLILE